MIVLKQELNSRVNNTTVYWFVSSNFMSAYWTVLFSHEPSRNTLMAKYMATSKTLSSY